MADPDKRKNYDKYGEAEMADFNMEDFMEQVYPPSRERASEPASQPASQAIFRFHRAQAHASRCECVHELAYLH